MDRQRVNRPPGRPPRAWTRRGARTMLLGLALTLALGMGGLLVGLLGGHPLLRSLMWAEFAGGTAVCAVAALLLLWRPREPGRTGEREETAGLGFRLMLAGALPLVAGLVTSWAWGL